MPRWPNGPTPGLHGIPPARALLTKSIAKTAAEIGVTPKQLEYVLKGMTPPSEVIRRRLPKAIGRPLRELFDRSVLAHRLYERIER